MKHFFSMLCLAAFILCNSAEARVLRHRDRPFVATAFSRRGTTSSGSPAQSGVVAADPSVLPLGTKIQVENAGPYSGTYTVADTGSKVRGRRIDIFVPNRLKARKFGKRVVIVKVVEWGEG
jgi:3D (Asp-Asp-Asp) domain-containing protein